MAAQLAFEQTGFFSKIATDYVEGQDILRPFYLYDVSLEGIKQAIAARKLFPQERTILAKALTDQYDGIEGSEAVYCNIQKLHSSDTFTVTTAHQPNIFTGPLYFLYKIAHAIKLSVFLKEKMPQYDFVPVYYMGSEDADLEEIGQFTVNGKKYGWNTKQTGAVGRMLVDKPLLQLLQGLKGQIDVESFGKELSALFERCYTLGKSIQQATLEIVHALFGRYGLVVLIPDNASLKKIFEPVVIKELQEKFSHPIVEKSSQALVDAGYRQQASGRDLNLFYLTEDKRERIEMEGNNFTVAALGLTFTFEEILMEVKAHPERFSGNVILRGIFQETILPNIVFVGGGGELAYWLELKNVFAAVNVPYPLLMLRNSFMLLRPAESTKLNALSISLEQIFQPQNYILDYLVNTKGTFSNDFTLQKKLLEKAYGQIAARAEQSEASLKMHAERLLAEAWQKLENLAAKMQRAERKKLQTEIQRIKYLKSQLFPHNNLQERVENIAAYYPAYGRIMIEKIVENSPALPAAFVVMEL